MQNEICVYLSFRWDGLFFLDRSRFMRNKCPEMRKEFMTFPKQSLNYVEEAS